MSIVYRIDGHSGVAYSVWQGAVTPAEFLATLERELADPDWPPRRRAHLVDLRTLTVPADPVTVEQTLATAASLYARHKGKGTRLRMAIVASEAFAQALTFQRLTLPGPIKVIVFGNLITACTWLGLDLTETERALQDLRVKAAGNSAA